MEISQWFLKKNIDTCKTWVDKSTDTVSRKKKNRHKTVHIELLHVYYVQDQGKLIQRGRIKEGGYLRRDHVKLPCPSPTVTWVTPFCDNLLKWLMCKVLNKYLDEWINESMRARIGRKKTIHNIQVMVTNPTPMWGGGQKTQEALSCVGRGIHNFLTGEIASHVLSSLQ